MCFRSWNKARINFMRTNSSSTIAPHSPTLFPADSDRQPEQESVNCAQFIFGQPGNELLASRFQTDPICPPLSCHRLDGPIATNTQKPCPHTNNAASPVIR